MCRLNGFISDFVFVMRSTPSKIRSLVENKRGKPIKNKYSDVSIKSYEDILMNKKGKFPIQPYLLKILENGIFKLKDAEDLNSSLDNAGFATATKNARKKVVGLFLRFLISEEIITYEKYALDAIEQTEVQPKPITTLTPEQRNVWDNEEWSKDPLINARNVVMFLVLRRYGDRPEIELARCNISDLDTKVWILRIHGKSGKLRFHRILKKDVPKFQEYLRLRSEFLRHNPGQPGSDALFIKRFATPRGPNNHNKTLRLSSDGIYACYDRMREKHPVLVGTRPYISRHTRITHAHIVCQILGIPIEYLDKNFGNSLLTRMNSYDGAFDLQEEIFLADFDTELIPLLEEMEQYCDCQLKEDPHDKLYIYCKKRIRDKIGEAGFLKIMAGRSPYFSKYFSSDSNDDFSPPRNNQQEFDEKNIKLNDETSNKAD